MSKTVIDRRRLLTAGALIGGAGAVAASADTPTLAPQPHTYHGRLPWTEGAADNPPQPAGTGYRFFGPDEAAFIEAAVARLIPSGGTGPGAIEANVPYFIDRQLDGPFGRGDHFYLGGPWPQGVKEQGYQSRFSPAQLYRNGIKATDAWARDKHGKLLRDLQPGDQDAVLHALESGDAKLDGVEAKTFFTMLHTNTVEGYFADPLYGGNKDMGPWKALGFPGAHYDYSAWPTRHGERCEIAPTGITGRPAWKEA